MNDFVSCKHCGNELQFVEMAETHTHKWKAECTNCTTKAGRAMFNDWVSDEQIELIVQEFPSTKIVPHQS